MDTIGITPERSACPIATTLDVIGDKWSLVVIRDMLTGKASFSEFLASPEGISTNILADRLRRLEATGLVAKEAYQSRPPRYSYKLTKSGEALLPVLQSICIWANAHIPGTWTPPEYFMRRRVRQS